jgi:hypothetical protein
MNLSDRQFIIRCNQIFFIIFTLDTIHFLSCGNEIICGEIWVEIYIYKKKSKTRREIFKFKKNFTLNLPQCTYRNYSISILINSSNVVFGQLRFY